MPIDALNPPTASSLLPPQARMHNSPQTVTAFRDALQQQQVQQQIQQQVQQRLATPPNAAQAQIQAAQIASQANVSMGVKHGLQLGGMRSQPLAPIQAPQRFMPIRHPLAPATAMAAAQPTPPVQTPSP